MPSGDAVQFRKLAAILVADVAGYSRLMGNDEKATVQTLTEYRQVFADRFASHQGHLVDTAGDSVLATFASPVEAVECAVEIQRELARRNRGLADDRKMNFRIGINLGDVIFHQDGTVYGDAVNVAARLESLAKPGGISISGSVFEHIENKLDVAVSFVGEESVKNIAKPVCTYRVMIDGSAAASQSRMPVRAQGGNRNRWIVLATAMLIAALGIAGWEAMRDRTSRLAKPAPVVAVLAFANMGEDAKQEYFSDGLTETIIDNLAQVREISVIARNSSFRYKGQAVDMRKVGEELGAKYVVQGSVRRSETVLRVTAQLVDSTNGANLWSKSYDRALTAANVFEIQDDIAAVIASTVAGFSGVVRQEGLMAARRKAPSDLSSYDCVLLGLEYYKTVSLQAFRVARDCVQGATKVDADYAPLWFVQSILARAEYQHQYDPGPAPLDRALAAVQKAIRLAPDRFEYHAEYAATRLYRGEVDEFKAAAARALELAPRGASVFGDLGIQFCYAGEWDKGLALIERAKVLDPFFPGWYHLGAFHDHYRKQQYDLALADAQRINLPQLVQAHSVLVAAYGQLGRMEEAREHIRRIYELQPDFDARKHWTARFRLQPDYLEHLLDGMRKAGMKISPKVQG